MFKYKQKLGFMERHDRIEDDYKHNKQNPGPSRESVEEKDDSSAGHLVQWAIGIAVVILLVIFIIYY